MVKSQQEVSHFVLNFRVKRDFGHFHTSNLNELVLGVSPDRLQILHSSSRRHGDLKLFAAANLRARRGC